MGRPVGSKSKNIVGGKDLQYEDEEFFIDPLAVMEHVEFLLLNRPKNPTKHYTKELEYYQRRLDKLTK